MKDSKNKVCAILYFVTFVQFVQFFLCKQEISFIWPNDIV